MHSGIEKNNDECRRIHLSKSNKWDAAADVLRVMKRMEMLSEHERAPRAYKKQKLDYWNGELKKKRGKQKSLWMQNGHDDANEDDLSNHNEVDTMSAAELRRELKRSGIQTRVRKLDRLQEMYRNVKKNQ